jgi:hypothetical protein
MLRYTDGEDEHGGEHGLELLFRLQPDCAAIVTMSVVGFFLQLPLGPTSGGTQGVEKVSAGHENE